MKGTFKGALIGALAAMLMLASGATAALAPGDPIRGGVVNTFDQRTDLTGNSANGMFRVINASTSTTTPTLWGVSNALAAPAIRGTSNANGIGVHGTSGSGSGVLGASNSGSGVQGVSTGGNGVAGKTAAGGASGVYGENNGGGFGVAGRSNGTNGIGVYGEALGTGGRAGHFNGTVRIEGTTQMVGNMTISSTTKVDNLNADMVDGISSAGFVQGAGKAMGQALGEFPGEHFFLGPPLAGFLRLSYFCPNPNTGNGALHIYNDSGSLANVFYESGGPNPNYTQMAAGTSFFVGAAATGDSFHIQAQGALGVLTIEVATVHRASDCHAQAQAVLTS